MRYKILAVALKKKIILRDRYCPVRVSFVLSKGEVSNLRVTVSLEGYEGYLDFDYYHSDIKYSSRCGDSMGRDTPFMTKSEKRTAVNCIFDMVDSKYLEDFVKMLNIIEALNNNTFANTILKLNNDLEETILPKDNYNNPNNRGFWFRVLRCVKFKKERDKYLSSKLRLAEKHIENICNLDKFNISDVTPKMLNDIRWAIDYKGWEWFYTRLVAPYYIPYGVEPKELKTVKVFTHNN